MVQILSFLYVILGTLVRLKSYDASVAYHLDGPILVIYGNSLAKIKNKQFTSKRVFPISPNHKIM